MAVLLRRHQVYFYTLSPLGLPQFKELGPAVRQAPSNLPYKRGTWEA